MKLRSLLLLALAVLPVLACESEVREANINQDKYIDNYITATFGDTATVFRNGGTTRVVLEEGPAGAPVIERGDSVYLYYAGYTFSQRGPEIQFVLDSGMVRVGSGKLIKGLENGLPGARLGEEAVILFSADDGYGNQAVGLVPANTALLFNVGVAMIKKNP
ncbi:MAG: FKBP-type peptidyl-prolyl cis-trans isomerase [Bacteroidales bacterium]|nr:FKBP-type peptidyl-prolyl cis-trans isomerase [Bacteroidales bacterium]